MTILTSTDIRTSGATSPVSSYQVNSEPPACSNTAYTFSQGTFEIYIHLNSACAYKTRPTHSPFRDIIHIRTQHTNSIRGTKQVKKTPGDTGESNTGFELHVLARRSGRCGFDSGIGSLEGGERASTESPVGRYHHGPTSR